MFRYFEQLIAPTRDPGDGGPIYQGPPSGLLPFYWHFVRQTRGLFVALLGAGLVVALMDAAIPYFIGRIVELAAGAGPSLAEQWPLLAGMGLTILLVRPLAVLLRSLLANQAIAPGFANLVRWQSHWHVVRQSWSFFQNDFAGRIANKVMQTGPAMRDTIVAATDAVWYIAIYGTTTLLLLAQAELWLTLPVIAWFVLYLLLLRHFVPRLRDKARTMSEARSLLTGRIVDSYTNILTVKLFARGRDEDDYVRAAVDEHTGLHHDQLRLITRFVFLLAAMNAALLVGAGSAALWLYSLGRIDIGTVAMVLPLTWQIVNISGWVGFQITAIFENIGVVQEGMGTIAQPWRLPDRAGARPLAVREGGILFDDISFGYGRERGVIEHLNLSIAPGEKIGLVGRSGAGKSTLVNLLLRFFELEGGRILIDGQDIAQVTQESLRAKIAVVTQDTSLLHRSILENIRYGRPEASEVEVLAAAKRAHAHGFIEELVDWKGQRGYDAQVGERGVKLSGGQRQRIAIARVILKNAPILVLDEATSALDSEVEQAIQGSLDDLMQGRTVIAIAHRLSTIARMDRLVVLEQGRIVEQGSHAELLAAGGRYADLWRRQSGGFLPDQDPAAMPLRITKD